MRGDKILKSYLRKNKTLNNMEIGVGSIVTTIFNEFPLEVTKINGNLITCRGAGEKEFFRSHLRILIIDSRANLIKKLLNEK